MFDVFIAIFVISFQI